MDLHSMKFPELKKQELGILTRRHHELLDRKNNLNTVEKMEFFLCLGLITATVQDKKPLKTAFDAWEVIWLALIESSEWRKRDYSETQVCFRVATTNVLKLIS